MHCHTLGKRHLPCLRLRWHTRFTYECTIIFLPREHSHVKDVARSSPSPRYIMQVVRPIPRGTLVPSSHVFRTRKTVRRSRCTQQPSATREDADGDVADEDNDNRAHHLPLLQRRSVLVGAGAMVSGLSPAPALAAGPSLSERLERKDFSKPVFNKTRPGPQEYPEWLEGTWNATTSFEGGGEGEVKGLQKSYYTSSTGIIQSLAAACVASTSG